MRVVGIVAGVTSAIVVILVIAIAKTGTVVGAVLVGTVEAVAPAPVVIVAAAAIAVVLAITGVVTSGVPRAVVGRLSNSSSSSGCSSDGGATSSNSYSISGHSKAAVAIGIIVVTFLLDPSSCDNYIL